VKTLLLALPSNLASAGGVMKKEGLRAKHASA